MTISMPTNSWRMLYFFAEHDLETWKKDSTYLSITGPVISGMVFVMRGGVCYRYWVIIYQVYSQMFGSLILVN